MSELEQLRKEVNELRERLARLEQGTARLMPIGPAPQPMPSFPSTWRDVHDLRELAKQFQPGTILC